MKRIYSYFSKPLNLSVLNGILLAILIVINLFFQAFCVPTEWARVVLTVCFLSITLFPVVERTRFSALFGFINGVSFLVFVYCIIFLEHINLIGLVMGFTGVGLAVLIPPFFVVQLIWKNVLKPVSKSIRYAFFAALILCSVAVFYAGKSYEAAILSIDRFIKSGYTELDRNFMTEKILGMHFIYHTRICEYDGWRPPKHDPALVIGMWLNNRSDPLDVTLKTRLELYKRFFPANKYKFECSCGAEYSGSYHSDLLWK